jgi:glycosyltransferase involved in cell wall biosynthesis
MKYHQQENPFVSVVTPTYNRDKFIKAMVECYKAYTYPKESMEWIVLDDGTESVESLFLEYTRGLPNIRYIRLDEKLNIGEKRNRLNAEAKGSIIISMDDDDWYSPERISHVVTMFQKYPSYQIAGSSELYLYYSDTGVILKLGPYGEKHATNGTMAYKSEYAKSHLYDDSVVFAEEQSFLNNYTQPILQLNPKKTMLVMSHSENTFDKDRFRNDTTNPFVKQTSLKLHDFVKDEALRIFYSTA